MTDRLIWTGIVLGLIAAVACVVYAFLVLQ